jgi:hypothetical protein
VAIEWSAIGPSNNLAMVELLLFSRQNQLRGIFGTSFGAPVSMATAFVLKTI